MFRDSYDSVCCTRRYAHQARPHLLVSDITCNNTASTNVIVNVSAQAAGPSPDLTTASAPPVYAGCPCWKGTIKEAEGGLFLLFVLEYLEGPLTHVPSVLLHVSLSPQIACESGECSSVDVHDLVHSDLIQITRSCRSPARAVHMEGRTFTLYLRPYASMYVRTRIHHTLRTSRTCKGHTHKHVHLHDLQFLARTCRRSACVAPTRHRDCR